MRHQLKLGKTASLLMALFMCSCFPARTTRETPSLISARPNSETPYPKGTPTYCSGWACTLDGTVLTDTAGERIGVAGVKVNMQQFSWCSPTKGKYETTSGEDGVFEFDVYLHDTDTFRIEIALEGYQPVSQAVGGFDCLYCACPPIEIILLPLE